MVEQVQLEKIPGFSQGVRPNAAARMVKMAQPICPNSKVKTIRTPEGKVIPDPSPDPARQNCQMDMVGDAPRIGWWDSCAERGHDPYFSTRRWWSEEDVQGEDGEWKSRRVPHELRYPNIAQVAAHPRVNGGMGVDFKMKKHGFKRLRDIGFEEVCQFRNCQEAVTVKSNHGLYCGAEHATYIAADAQGIMLEHLDPLLNTGSEQGLAQKRYRQLMEAGTFAGIQPIKK